MTRAKAHTGPDVAVVVQPAPALVGELARVGQRLAVLLDARESGEDLGALGLAEPAELEAESALGRLRDVFGLTPFEVDVLLLAVAADVDARFGSAYAFLQDDPSRRRPSVGVAFDVLGVETSNPAARKLLGPTGALRRWKLVDWPSSDRPLIDRPLQPAGRVVAHLLEDDTSEPDLGRLFVRGRTHHPLTPSVLALADAIDRGTRFVFLRDRRGSAARELAAASFEWVGLPTVTADLGRLPDGLDPADVAVDLVREAALLGAVAIIGPISALGRRAPEAVAAFATAPVPVVLHDRGPWVSTWAEELPLLLEADALDGDDIAAMWATALDDVSGPDLVASASRFRLGPGEIHRAVEGALVQAAAAGVDVTPDLLAVSVRAHHGPALDQVARRIVPRATFDDLVLPPEVEGQLRSVVARAHHRALVQDEWGMGSHSDRGNGTSVLFVGPPGTGKTLSAEVVARELGLELFAIDLSSVVDKYIGETEKHLDGIFAAAEGVNAVLLFDEADALFGQRSSVSDARDRYANVEVSYLLQRLESFEGIALLTTNLQGNIDPAFARRFASIVQFDVPGPDVRQRIWERHLPPSLPRAEELDVAFLAKAFELAGGAIRNITISAAYAAAEDGTGVTMGHLVRSTRAEQVKVGRVVQDDAFGPYAPLLDD